jgi:ribosomal protein S18 acetylase RimI-like enzyme
MIQIRKARASDAPFIVKSQIAMAKETEDLALDRPTVEKGVAALFEDPRLGEYYIAERKTGDVVETIACLLTMIEWSEWRNGRVIWIHSVYVIPSERRSGVYRSMYGHLKTRVEQDPTLRGLRLYVDRKNVNAQNTYQQLGMTKEHYEMYEWMK